MQHLAVGAVERPAGLQVHQLRPAGGTVLPEGPAAGLRGVARQGQAVEARQLRRMLRPAVQRQVAGRRHAEPPVVGQAQADQGRIGHVADPHRAVEALAGQVDHPVAEVERQAHLGMRAAEPRQQRRHVPPAEARRRGDPQMAAGPHPAGTDAGFGIGPVGQQPLCVFQESGALVGQRQPPGGAHHQLDAEPRLQRVQPPAHDRRRHALGQRGRGEAAALGHGDEGFDLLELVHVASIIGPACGPPAGARHRPVRHLLLSANLRPRPSDALRPHPGRRPAGRLLGCMPTGHTGFFGARGKSWPPRRRSDTKTTT